MKADKKLYVVSEEMLPEALVKTAAAKEMIRRKEVSGTSEAIEKLGISRSTFYKYRDGISTFYDLGAVNIANISLVLDHSPGVLSAVLAVMAKHKGNVLTINQGLPSHGTAVVTLSVGLDHTDSTLEQLLSALGELDGVEDVEIDGINRA